MISHRIPSSLPPRQTVNCALTEFGEVPTVGPPLQIICGGSRSGMCQSCSSNADCKVSHPGARAPSPLFPCVSTVPFPPPNSPPRPPQTGSGLTCYKTFRGGPFPFTIPGCSGAAADKTHYCADVPTNYLNYSTSDPALGTAL